ncbi:MAG: hypothetical protein R3B54_04515 [Bdellovibrionota bacterium]
MQTPHIMGVSPNLLYHLVNDYLFKGGKAILPHIEWTVMIDVQEAFSPIVH